MVVLSAATQTCTSRIQLALIRMVKHLGTKVVLLSFSGRYYHHNTAATKYI